MISRKWLASAMSVVIPFIAQTTVQNQSEIARTSSAAQGLPAIKRDWLLNGLQIMMIERPGTGRLRAQLRVNSGALFDLAGRGGLAELTARAMLKGGRGLAGRDLAEAIKQSDLKLTLAVTWDSTDLAIEAPADSLESAIDLLARLVVKPNFDPKEFESVKAGRIAELNGAPPDEMEVTKGRALEGLFGTHPFGRPERGGIDSISQISRADLLYYHSRFYIANNAELMVIGDVTADQVVRLTRAKLGTWRKGEKVPATFRPPEPQTSRQIVILDRAGAGPAKAALAQMGISRRTGDYYAALIMGEVLTALVKKADSSTAAVGGVRVSLEPRYIPGPLVFEVVAPTEKTGAVLEGILSAMHRLRAGQAPLDEIESAKQRIVSQFESRMNTIEGFAEANLDIELYGLGRDYLVHFTEWVEAVTPSEVQQASNKYLSPHAFTAVVSAPAAEVQPYLSPLGGVIVIKTSGQAK